MEPVAAARAVRTDIDLRKTVEASVVDVLREDIVRLVLAPGSRLALDEFAARYSVSMTPMRQAIRRLEAEGLVVSVSRRGSRVAPLSVDDLDLVVTVSESVESRLATLATPNATDEDIARIDELLLARRRAVETDDLDLLYSSIWEVRSILGVRAERPLLFDEAARWRKRYERYQRFMRTFTDQRPRYEERLAGDFQKFVEAVRVRDGVAAGRATASTYGWMLQEISGLLPVGDTFDYRQLLARGRSAHQRT